MTNEELRAQHVMAVVAEDDPQHAASWLTCEWRFLSYAERVEVMKLLQKKPLGGAVWAAMRLIWDTEAGLTGP